MKEKEAKLDTLEDLLQQFSEAKCLILKNKKKIGSWSDGECEYDRLSSAGHRAYSKLVRVLYGVGYLTGLDVDHLVDKMDEIVETEAY